MQNISFKTFKSGSDVRGYASGKNVTLTDEAVIAITRAFVKWLSAKHKKQKFKIAVGNDCRVSAQRIVSCVAQAITASGSDAVLCGLASTPSMFILLKKSDWDCDASIMITASHLPSDRNGLKFFTPEGGLGGKDIDEILALAESGAKLSGKGNITYKSYMDDYCNLLVNTVRNDCGIQKPLQGKKIIVDAGNGAGGFFTEKVLKPLGADTQGSLLLEPDGTFPNHIPNPEDKQAITCLSHAVIKEKADLGIIFDTDVDRAGAVDADGSEINRNRLIALVSALLLKERKGVIVTDSVTSDGLTQFIEKLGGEHLRYMRGYRNVIDKCIELNDCGVYSPLAIETSGHAAFKENFYLDDGAYLITRLLCALAKGGNLGELISSLPEPLEADEVRITFDKSCAEFKKEGAQVIENLKKAVGGREGLALAPYNYEGVRINFKKGYGDGWTLVRMSVHDPVMPINFESVTSGGNKLMAETLMEYLKDYTFLNIDNLKKFING